MRPRISASVVIFSALAVWSSPAGATHFRGGDAWATIDANGVVTVHANTRWEKGALTDPQFDAGVNPTRFGATNLNCHHDNLPRPTPPAVFPDVAGLRIYRVSDG